MNLLNEMITFSVIFSIVIAGIIIRNVWDEKVDLPASKVLTGAAFLSLIIYASNCKTNLNITTLIIPSLLTGFKCENLMQKYILMKADNLFKN